MKGTDNPNSEAEGGGRLFSVLDRGLTYVSPGTCRRQGQEAEAGGRGWTVWMVWIFW